MSRALFITIHMYLSAFFAVFVLLVAISGGLYLLGYKGSVEKQPVYSSESDPGLTDLLSQPTSLSVAVADLLEQAGVEDFSFEYVKVKGSTLYTRPTSRTHYVIELDDGVQVSKATPSLQAAMMELHMGHGPLAFKNFQKFFAVGMIFIMASGIWLGLSSERLRPRTLAAAGGGALAFFVVLLI